MKNIKILIYIRHYVTSLETTQLLELDKKQSIISLIEEKWSKEKIEKFNKDLSDLSLNCIDYNYSEEEIKLSMIYNNSSLFDTDEKEELFKKIKQENKLKMKSV